MKFPEFDRVRIEEELKLIGSRDRVAFVALCAERLLPFYRWFSATQGRGDYERLRSALDAVWACVEGNSLSREDCESRIAECSRVTPDTEAFAVPLASRAMDAAVLATEALKMCLEPSARRAAEAAEVAVDAAFGIEQTNAADHVDQVRIADRARLAALFRSTGVSSELETQRAVLAALKAGDPHMALLRKSYSSPGSVG